MDTPPASGHPADGPPHRRLSSLALAFLGGAVGSALRELVNGAYPEDSSLPFATLTVNISGAFVLAALATALARRVPVTDWHHRIRVLLGTGLMGGFTTYSALATETAGLLAHGRAAAGIGYAAATLVLGGIATWAGIAAVTLGGRQRAGDHP